MTLKEFMDGTGTQRNAYVEHPPFEPIYVRRSPRYIKGTRHERVLTIANITLPPELRGQRHFTALCAHINREGWGCYVECAHGEGLAEKLAHLGFIEIVQADWYRPADYVRWTINKEFTDERRKDE